MELLGNILESGNGLLIPDKPHRMIMIMAVMDRLK